MPERGVRTGLMYDIRRDDTWKAGNDLLYGHGASGGAAGSHPSGGGSRTAACRGRCDGHAREHGARAVYFTVAAEGVRPVAAGMLAGAEDRQATPIVFFRYV